MTTTRGTIESFFSPNASNTRTNAKRNGVDDDRPLVPSSSSSSSFARCPLCAKDIHRAMLATHATTCAGEEPAKDDRGRAKRARAMMTTMKTTTLNEASNEIRTSGNDALTRMMARGRARERSRWFSLTYDATRERWMATIGKSSQFANATWSSVVVIKEKLRDGAVRETTMKVETNTTPRDDDVGPTIERTTRDALKDARVVTEMRKSRNPSSEELKMSVIKSALQKSIRRGLAVSASRIAMHMSLERDSFVECVRRLVIISLEDAILHPDVSVLTWLMCAMSKGYCPTDSMRASVSRIAGEMATIGVKDCVSYGAARSKSDVALVLGDVESKLAEGEENTIVQSLIIRAHFGGMPGDVEMLRGFSRVWLERFAQKDVHANVPSEYDNLRNPELIMDDKSKWLDYLELAYDSAKKMGEDHDPAKWGGALRRCDIPLAAIDFHVSPCVEAMIKIPTIRAQVLEAAQELGLSDIDVADRIKSAIWRNSAGVNYRVAQKLRGETTSSAADDNDDDADVGSVKARFGERIWNIVRDDLEKWVKRYLASRMPL